VVETVVGDVGCVEIGGTGACPLKEFDPVTVWIESKSDCAHRSLGELLVERDAEFLESGACVGQRTHRDAYLRQYVAHRQYMSESPASVHFQGGAYRGSVFPEWAFQSLSGFSVPQL
jgi:hypothetical protein